jgi:hypothetical protein
MPSFIEAATFGTFVIVGTCLMVRYFAVNKMVRLIKRENIDPHLSIRKTMKKYSKSADPDIRSLAKTIMICQYLGAITTVSIVSIYIKAMFFR